MTRVNQPKTDARKASFVIAEDAPVRHYRKVTLSRDEWDALRSGGTLEDVRLSRREILARKEGT